MSARGDMEQEQAGRGMRTKIKNVNDAPKMRENITGIVPRIS